MTLKKLLSTDNVIILLFSFSTFMFIGNYIGSDLRVHLLQVIKINNGEAGYPPNFLYYYLANLFSFFSNNISILYISGFSLLSIATVFKYILTKKILLESFTMLKVKVSNFHIVLISIVLLLFFPILDYYHLGELGYMYLGKITPNVWHNSTIIFLQPFTLLLFWEQFKVLSQEDVKSKSLILIVFLIVLNALIKPSFLFVFIPASLIMIMFNASSLLRQKMLMLFPLIIGLGMLFVLGVLIYVFEIGNFKSGGETGINLFMPLDFYLAWLPKYYFPFAMIFSFLFPIVILFLKANVYFSKPVMFASIMMFGSLIISFLFVEEGVRRSHGNFVWQNIPTLYILVLTLSIKLIELYKKGTLSKTKSKVILMFFLLHVFSGVIYLGRIFFFKEIV